MPWAYGFMSGDPFGAAGSSPNILRPKRGGKRDLPPPLGFDDSPRDIASVYPISPTIAVAAVHTLRPDRFFPRLSPKLEKQLVEHTRFYRIGVRLIARTSLVTTSSASLNLSVEKNSFELQNQYYGRRPERRRREIGQQHVDCRGFGIRARWIQSVAQMPWRYPSPQEANTAMKIYN